MNAYTVILTSLVTTVCAWMPKDRNLQAFTHRSSSSHNYARTLPNRKIRGVNLGGWLISEPWKMGTEWSDMGCKGNRSEFDCVSSLSQSQANKVFDDHCARWITPATVQDIRDAGLNTMRIPIGYWSLRSIVNGSENFSVIDLQYLDAVIQKAADLGMFVVMDLHGAPGAQKVGHPFTGRILEPQDLPGFFTQSNYDRAIAWLDWMTRRIHNTPSYSATVGIIEVVNEPQTFRDKGGIPKEEKDTLTQRYYPQALAAVRDVENNMSIPTGERLHVQFMDKLWGAGDPKSNLSDANIIFDDHNYVGGAGTASHPNATKADYMNYTCHVDDRLSDGDTPKVVQEWSLTVSSESSPEFDWESLNNTAFYKQWFVAQQRLYERTNGWIFWTWNTQLNDSRWDYSYLVYKNWVPTTAAGLDASATRDVCKEYLDNSTGR